MSNNNVFKLIQPGSFDDQLTEILRQGARTLLAQAVQAEVVARELSRNDLLAGGPSAAWSIETRRAVRNTIERIVIQNDELQIVRKPATLSAAAAR